MTDITDIAKARKEFEQHKRGAAYRGIGFELTFEQWCEIWEKSGKYPERGARKGQHGMQRFLDLGPYAVGNVEIGNLLENGYTRRVRNSYRQVGPKRARQRSRPILAGVLPSCNESSPEEILCELEDA